MSLLAILGAVMLAFTLGRGWHPYPFIGRAYRGGENASMFWFAVIIEIVFVIVGVAAYFSN